MKKCKPFCNELKIKAELKSKKKGFKEGLYKCPICGFEKIFEFKNGK